jgi:hypothetical protein
MPFTVGNIAWSALSATVFEWSQLRICYLHHTIPEKKADVEELQRPTALRESGKNTVTKDDPLRYFAAKMGRDDLYSKVAIFRNMRNNGFELYLVPGT